MNVQTPAQGRSHQPWSPGRLTRWSLLMIVVYVVWALVLGMTLGALLMSWLGLSEGDLLLMAGGAGGWLSSIAMSALIAVPLVLGTVLGVKAVRRGSRRVWIALVINVLLLAQIVFAFLDAIRMTYHPEGGWLLW